MGRVLGVVIAIVAVVGILFASGYNGMVNKQENVQTQYANLDAQLQRRADLIPNLVSTVKGYMAHEEGIIDKITTARENLNKASNVEEMQTANDELTKAINNLMVVVENYPDLKASQNFINLQDELAGTENRIAVARKDYNDAVKSYNTSIKKFPNNILAGMFGFEIEKYFEADETSREVPSVSFE